VVGRRQAGTLPIPEYIGVTGASCNDGKIFDQIRPELHNNELYGDKAYQRSDAEAVRNAQNLAVLTPVKKKKDRNIESNRTNGYQPPFLVFDSQLKHYLLGLKKKQVLNARVRFDYTMVSWYM